jgi:hypothetical protein
MRKERPPKKAPKQQRDAVIFDRAPAKDRLDLALDIAIATASEHGVSGSDIVEALLLCAEREAVLAKDRGENLEQLAELLFGKENEEDAHV